VTNNYEERISKLCKTSLRILENLFANYFIQKTLFTNNGKFDEQILYKIFTEKNIEAHFKDMVTDLVGDCEIFDPKAVYGNIMTLVTQNEQSVETLGKKIQKNEDVIND
jgi:hypothetical protein